MFKNLFFYNIFSSFKDSGIYLILKILVNLNYKFKKKLTILFFLIILNGLFEGATVALIFSFLSILTNINNSENNLFIVNYFNNFGIYNNNNIIIILSLTLSILILFSGAIRLLNLWTNSILSESITTYISTKIFRNVLYQQYTFHKRLASSEIINAVTYYARVTGTSINYLITFITALIISTFIIGTIFIINFKISLLIILFTLGSYLLIGLLTHEKLKKNSKRAIELSNQQIETIQISLNSIKDILLDSSQDYFLRTHEKTDRVLRRTFGETRFIASFPKIVIETLVLVFISILGYLIFKEGSQMLYLIPILGTIIISLQKLFPFNQQIFSCWSQVKANKDSINAVFKLLNLEPKRFLKKHKLKNIKFNKIIELNNICFCYPDSNKKIFKEFSLQIKKGSKIGIKGRTGKGKSTLINILMGLLIPDKGEYLVDGFNLYSEDLGLNLASWGSKIAHIPQEISLLNKSFFENIAFGIYPDEVDHEKVKIAAKIACIDEFISSKDLKYETNIGENGSLLSGGQKQRIGIARALYKNLDILILDEATNALDYKTEKKVINSLFSMKEEMTFIFISHNDSILEKCDEIIEI